MAFLTGCASLAGLALIDRRDLVPLGSVVIAISGVSLGILCRQVWTDFDSERWSLDALIVVVAALVVASARLLHRRFLWLYWASAALTVRRTGEDHPASRIGRGPRTAARIFS